MMYYEKTIQMANSIICYNINFGFLVNFYQNILQSQTLVSNGFIHIINLVQSYTFFQLLQIKT